MSDAIDPALLAQVLAGALAGENTQTDALSQDDFSARYEPSPDWAVGPFRAVPELGFELEGQWDDPDGIGWTSASIFNPSMIAVGEELHLFYRASPRKESLASRIGHAVHRAGAGWTDDPANPVVRPTTPGELLGVEDPKVYAADDGYVLFYNAIFPVDEEERRRHPSPGFPVGDVGCDIHVATSPDLRSWTKRGPITPHETTRLWTKGAVIPRDGDGRAVRVDGSYLMYLSEGFDGLLHVGRSDDLLRWSFEPCPYLDLTPLGGGPLHEVATAIVTETGELVLDFFYDDAGRWAAAQALYRLDAPFTQLEVHRGGSLAWGGLVRQDGRWAFAQGWDAPAGRRRIDVYRSL